MIFFKISDGKMFTLMEEEVVKKLHLYRISILFKCVYTKEKKKTKYTKKLVMILSGE